MCIYIYVYIYHYSYVDVKAVKLTFHFQCKTLFTIMIYIDTIMTKCNSSR